MSEFNHVPPHERKACAGCNKVKVWLHVPQASKRYRRVEADGSVWNGKFCSACTRGARKARYREQELAPVITKRKCRRCKKNLPAKYYFYHEQCRPDIFAETDDQEDYACHL